MEETKLSALLVITIIDSFRDKMMWVALNVV